MSKTDFDYLADHKRTRIESITVTEKGVKIKYADTNNDDNTIKSTLDCPEPAHGDLEDNISQMNAFVTKYFINKADSKVTNSWAENISTRGITFRHNSKGVSAQISAIYRGTDGQFGELKTPATPLYDESIEGHEAGAVDTFGALHTPTLEAIMQEARMYLGGKRGDMQQQLDGSEGNQGGAAD